MALSQLKNLAAFTVALSIWPAAASAETVFVKSVNDSGPNTLRAAITFANTRPGSTIAFSIPRDALRDGVATIRLKSALPSIRAKGTRIDGTTQARFIGDTNPKGPEIVINGAQAAMEFELTASALHVTADHCLVSGLVINNFVSIDGLLSRASGIVISGAKATQNRVTGCYIGTDATGTAQLGNAFGIYIIDGAHGNIIGGTAASNRNLISGNDGNGISIYGAGTDGNIVQGNYIGTDITGAVKLPNAASGVHIGGGAGRNVIGGTTTAARNIISGNRWAGVALYDFGTNSNIVQGNYVGTDVSGTFALGNTKVGVHITEDAQENLIGGVEKGAGNLISGNDALGVCLCKRVKNNKVQGNRIGTNAEGTVAVPNDSGITIREGSSGNLIGGTLAGAGNLVSGNKGNALALAAPGTMNNAIQGNIIGLDATANTPLGNRLGLAILSGASSNRVGGAESGAANIIAGNHESGIVLIDANTQKNLVQGNFIGTNSKMARLVNEDRGIRIADGAHDNIVGGTKSSEANTILANRGAILISGDKTTGNLTEGNIVESAVVGNWRSGQTKNEFTPMEWDVTPFIKEVKALGEQAADNQNADYVFRFQYTGGNHRLDIEWAELWVNGKLLSRDTHRGSTGNANENNEYRFSLPVPDPQATYILRANILSGGDSNGEIQLSRKSREPK
ncbi:MAG TPA: hypothetical protein VGB77_13570 [Abditibacteriaceae bacterium]|jgi:hypothetical protein